MKHISIIIIITLIAFGSWAFSSTNTFSEFIEEAFQGSDASEASDPLGNVKEKEENLPTFLQFQSKYEYVNGNDTKKLILKPIGLKSGETPYKALILMNAGGLELIRADVESGQVKVKKFENNSFQNSTQTTFDIDFKIVKNEKLYLYTLADDGSTHCTEIASDFFNVDYNNKTKQDIAPLRKKSKPGWDKLTNQPISDCFFAKPLNDGKSYAWKGDVKARIQKGTFDDKGYSASFQIKFDKLPKDNDAFINFKNEETGQTALRFLFDKGELLYQNNKGKTFYTNTTIKEKEWVTIGWTYSKYHNANTTYYINGVQVANDAESTVIDWSKSNSLSFTKGTGNWEMNNLIFWSEVRTQELVNAPLITPKPTDANIKGLFLFNEGAGQKMLNDKISGLGITVNGIGDCNTSWTASTYQPATTLDFNNTYIKNNFKKNITNDLSTTGFTLELWSDGRLGPSFGQFSHNGRNYIPLDFNIYDDTFFFKYQVKGYQYPGEYRKTEKLPNPQVTKKWSHWAFTYDVSKEELQVYIDGTPTFSYQNIKLDYIKDIKKVSMYAGKGTDEVRLWSTIRTAKQIKDNYRHRIESTNCNELIINEHFDKQPHKAAILSTDKKDCQGNNFTKISKQTLTFDGNDDRIVDEIDIANKSFTVEFWAKRAEASREEYILSGGSNTGSNTLLHIGFRNDNRFTFAFWGDDVNVDSKYNDKKWHHWACVYDATKKEQIVYQDGKEVGKKTNSNPFQGTKDISIGSRLVANYFKGNLTEIRIWDVARTSAEVNAHKSSPLTGICPNLLLYYNFDKVKNNELFNLISNKKANIQNFGTTPFAADFFDFKNTPKDGCIVPPGSVDYTLLLNGQSDHVTTSQDIDLNKKPFTIEFWAKRTVDNKQQIVVTHGESNIDDDNNLILGFDANNKFFANYEEKRLTAKTAIDNNWHHYTYVYDYNFHNHLIFVDGQFADAAKKGRSYELRYDPYITKAKFLVGRRTNTGREPFGGEIDELRVWNKALQQSIIKNHYQAKYPNTEKDLLAYYNFNDGKGTTLTDVKSGNNGTISTVKNVSLAWQKSTKPVKLNPPQPVQNGYYAKYGYKSFGFDYMMNKNVTIMFWMKKGRSGTLESGGEKYTNTQLFKIGQELDIQGTKVPINNDNKWEHYAIAIKYSGRDEFLKIYKNGTLVAQSKVGQFDISQITINNKIAIDDLYVFQKALNENEIKQYMTSFPVMNSTFGKTNDIVGDLYYYNPFDNETKGEIKFTPTIKPTTNYALKFDGYNDYVEYNGELKKGSNSISHDIREYTIETWINPSKIKESCIYSISGILNLKLKANGNLVTQMKKQDYRGGGYVEKTIPITINPNQWTHIAWTFKYRDDKTHNSRYITNEIFVNGVNTKVYDNHHATYDVGKLPTNIKMTIGARHDKKEYFEGSIDEIRIHNGLYNESTIKSLMNKQLTGGEQNLIFYTSFDENKGADVQNRTIANVLGIEKYATMHKGKLHNMSSTAWTTGPPIQVVAPMPYIPAPQKQQTTPSGDCALQTQFGQHRITFDGGMKGEREHTTEFWLYLEDYVDKSNLITIPSKPYQYSGDDYETTIAIHNNMLLYNSSYIGLRPSPLPYNKWVHISIVHYYSYSDYNFSVYINGSYLGGSRASKQTTSNEIIFNPNKGIKCKIDDIKVWKTKRTETEIKSDMTSSSYSDSNMLRYFPCNECSGTNVDDRKNNKDATVHDSTDNPFGQSGPKK